MVPSLEAALEKVRITSFAVSPSVVLIVAALKPTVKSISSLLSSSLQEPRTDRAIITCKKVIFFIGFQLKFRVYWSFRKYDLPLPNSRLEETFPPWVPLGRSVALTRTTSKTFLAPRVRSKFLVMALRNEASIQVKSSVCPTTGPSVSSRMTWVLPLYFNWAERVVLNFGRV